MLHRCSNDADTALQATVCDLIGLALAPASRAAQSVICAFATAPPSRGAFTYIQDTWGCSEKVKQASKMRPHCRAPALHRPMWSWHLFFLIAVKDESTHASSHTAYSALHLAQLYI
jgi:hypothetical protein